MGDGRHHVATRSGRHHSSFPAYRGSAGRGSQSVRSKRWRDHRRRYRHRSRHDRTDVGMFTCRRNRGGPRYRSRPCRTCHRRYQKAQRRSTTHAGHCRQCGHRPRSNRSGPGWRGCNQGRGRTGRGLHHPTCCRRRRASAHRCEPGRRSQLWCTNHRRRRHPHIG